MKQVDFKPGVKEKRSNGCTIGESEEEEVMGEEIGE